MSQTAASHELWDHMFELHSAELSRKEAAKCVVGRDGMPSELTPFGFVRWYLHPRLTEPVSRTMYFLELEIPAGSHTGMLRHQGSIVHLVVEGSGYTLLNGERHDWEQGDIIGIPSRPEGAEIQHYADEGTPARLTMAWPNMDSAMGPGLGVDLKVLKPAPEYRSRTWPA